MKSRIKFFKSHISKLLSSIKLEGPIRLVRMVNQVSQLISKPESRTVPLRPGPPPASRGGAEPCGGGNNAGDARHSTTFTIRASRMGSCFRMPSICRDSYLKSVVAVIALLALVATARAEDSKPDLESQEQKALTAAADRVAPCVVRIETIGGLERVEKILFGAGPTTGLIVDPQGYIISSAFNFVNKPSSILVRFPDGTRKPARLISRDTSRMVVLLKIETDHPLPVPQAAPEAEARVGQWCIAIGRTYEDEKPNVAIGILSAINRIWGKAYQTDAAVSPSNYGGPLVDIRGRVMGVLVPLSPQAAEEIAGVEWYDSGIGFAVPLETIMKSLPRMKKGENLTAGVAGVYMKSKNDFTGDTVISSCRPNSPAARAGFKADDRVVEIAGHKITRKAEVRQEIGKFYAGDKINVVVERNGKRIAKDIELVDRLEPYRHGFLGVLPMREPPGADSSHGGVPVRYVYPGLARLPPLAKIEAGDLLHSLSGKPIKSRDELLRDIATVEPGMAAEFEVVHKGKSLKVTVKLDELPEGLPPATMKTSMPAHGSANKTAER